MLRFSQSIFLIRKIVLLSFPFLAKPCDFAQDSEIPHLLDNTCAPTCQMLRFSQSIFLIRKIVLLSFPFLAKPCDFAQDSEIPHLFSYLFNELAKYFYSFLCILPTIFSHSFRTFAKYPLLFHGIYAPIRKDNILYKSCMMPESHAASEYTVVFPCSPFSIKPTFLLFDSSRNEQDRQISPCFPPEILCFYEWIHPTTSIKFAIMEGRVNVKISLRTKTK